MCKIQIEQSYFQFSFSANADNSSSRRLRPMAARRTKSSPKHTMPGPPRHSVSTGGPGLRICAELPPQIDAQADRGHPRRAEFHCVAGTQLLRRHIAQRLLGRFASRWRISSRRGRGRHGYVSSVAAGGLLHTGQISDEQDKEGRRASGRFEKEVRVLAARGEIKFKRRRPRPLLYTGRGASGNLQANSAASISGHVKNPRGTTSSEGSISTI
jgi:hypothetical protein